MTTLDRTMHVRQLVRGLLENTDSFGGISDTERKKVASSLVTIRSQSRGPSVPVSGSVQPSGGPGSSSAFEPDGAISTTWSARG